MRNLIPAIVILIFLLSACQPAPASPTPLPPAPTDTPPAPPATAIPAQAPGTLVVYDDLTSWENWSWNTISDPFSTEQFFSGENAIKISFQEPWAGFSLRSSTPINPGDYSALSLSVYSSEGEQSLLVFVQTQDDNSESAKFTITATPSWQQFIIPMEAFGNPTAIKRISIQDNGDAAAGQPYPRPAVYLDDIQLVP